MTNRQLWEAIGYVDDELILAADAPVVRRRKPPVYWRQLVSAAACACLLAGGVAVWHGGLLTGSTGTSVTGADSAPALGASNEESATDDAAPYTAESSAVRMVRVGGVLYADTGAVSESDADADGVFLGIVDSGETPTENDTANFDGAVAYRYGDGDTLDVFIDGQWYVFAAQTE